MHCVRQFGDGPSFQTVSAGLGPGRAGCWCGRQSGAGMAGPGLGMPTPQQHHAHCQGVSHQVPTSPKHTPLSLVSLTDGSGRPLGSPGLFIRAGLQVRQGRRVLAHGLGPPGPTAAGPSPRPRPRPPLPTPTASPPPPPATTAPSAHNWRIRVRGNRQPSPLTRLNPCSIQLRKPYQLAWATSGARSVTISHGSAWPSPA